MGQNRAAQPFSRYCPGGAATPALAISRNEEPESRCHLMRSAARFVESLPRGTSRTIRMRLANGQTAHLNLLRVPFWRTANIDRSVGQISGNRHKRAVQGESMAVYEWGDLSDCRTPLPIPKTGAACPTSMPASNAKRRTGSNAA